MFTGIIETTGEITAITTNGTNQTFWISSSLSNNLKVDQSVSHNGVCLTVEEVMTDKHRVTAIDETLCKTELGTWNVGTIINLERCLQLHDRIDGHMVQGHVDGLATCTTIQDKDGSFVLTFSIPSQFAHLIIEKGSISINGISLTLFAVDQTGFSVAIIPYTWEHTNLKTLQVGKQVNIEFDMMGKYIARYMELRS